MANIYNNNGRLKAALKRLDTLDITNQNKEDILSFLHYVASYGCSVGRQAKYIYPLQNLAKWIGKDYMKATKDDIQLLVEYISTAKKGDPEPLGIDEVKKYNLENKDDRTPKYTAWSRMDYQIIIKKFWKWLYNRHIDDEEDWATPKLVKFIKPKKPRDCKKVPGDLLNKKDIELLLKFCRTLREKCLILVMYESGARIGEILNLKIKDISFVNDGVHLGLNGKTGYRRILLVGSAPAITQWIAQEHPAKNNRDSYLFCNINRGKEGTQLSYASVKKILRTLKEKSGFQKPINPHHFRHSRSTDLAEVWTDAQRCQFLGWVHGSDMARIYTHLSDTDRIVRETNGLIEKKEENGKFTSVICPRCGNLNPFGSEECSKCFLKLQSDIAKEEVNINRRLKFIEKREENWMELFIDMKNQLSSIKNHLDFEESDRQSKAEMAEKFNAYLAEQEQQKQKSP